MSNNSLIIGPAVGFYIISILGFQRLFNVVTVIALVVSVASLFAKEKHRLRKSPHPAWSLQTGLLAVEALPLAWTVHCLGLASSSAHFLVFSVFLEHRALAFRPPGDRTNDGRLDDFGCTSTIGEMPASW